MKSKQWVMKSKIGHLHLVASEAGLQGVFWKKQKAPLAKSLSEAEPAVRMLARAARELEEYLAGERKKFGLPLDMRGTVFQKQVWAQLQKIPFGKTCSYAQIAVRIRNSKAVRAVGSANGKNPLCIIVPCHRVISSDGTLGGYSGGLKIKTRLLALETRGKA